MLNSIAFGMKLLIPMCFRLSKHYANERQNRLRGGERDEPNDIRKIVETYQFRNQADPRYSRRVSMEEIEKNDFNLNISRYVSTSIEDKKVDLQEVNKRGDIS